MRTVIAVLAVVFVVFWLVLDAVGRLDDAKGLVKLILDGEWSVITAAFVISVVGLAEGPRLVRSIRGEGADIHDSRIPRNRDALVGAVTDLEEACLSLVSAHLDCAELDDPELAGESIGDELQSRIDVRGQADSRYNTAHRELERERRIAGADFEEGMAFCVMFITLPTTAFRFKDGPTYEQSKNAQEQISAGTRFLLRELDAGHTHEKYRINRRIRRIWRWLTTNLPRGLF